MQDFHEKGMGMWDKDPQFQTLFFCNTVEPLFREHPQVQGKHPLNGGWARVCS